MATITRTGIDEILERAVAEGAVPSVAAIAADRNGIIYEGAAGTRVAGGDEPVTVDTHFRIMSMTKIVATTVALQLVEQGKLDLDAPVERYCPEFAEVEVLEGFDGDTPRTRPPASKATVKQLVTHTTGLGYWFFSPELVKWESVTGIPNILSGLNAIFKAPMLDDPGSRFIYGINLDWLGQVIHAASGMKLDEAIAHGVTDPLGMKQTTFVMSDAQRANSVPIHLQGEDGAWAATEIDLVQEPEYWAGGHGLHSTPRDYMKFQRMLLGNGTSPDGVKILESATVDAAFTNQIGDLDFPAELATADPTATCDFNAGAGFKWGYGLLLNSEDIPGARRAGTGSWAGLLNTHFWVDRTTGIAAAIYSQTLPFVTGPALALYQTFEGALYASL
ncbi:MAG TPA: serine hydrolase domain-containing protein [Solirubrobacteraceae bacterium]|nr:serine hydrolase domain-containing protein [Solirubrobacteraceae bacterium]